MGWTWFVAALSLIATVANVKKQRWCFAVWMLTNLVWAVYDWRIGAHAQSLLFSAYFVISAWGFVSWREGRRVR